MAGEYIETGSIPDENGDQIGVGFAGEKVVLSVNGGIGVFLGAEGRGRFAEAWAEAEHGTKAREKRRPTDVEAGLVTAGQKALSSDQGGPYDGEAPRPSAEPLALLSFARPHDPEAVFLADAIDALKRMDDDAKGRVLRYLADRYGVACSACEGVH